MLNASKLEYSESPNATDDFQFDYGEPKSPRPDVLTSFSISVDSQSDEHDFQPNFWKSTGHFQFDYGEPKSPRPDVLTSFSISVDSQSDEHDFQPNFWKSTGHFQEISQSAADVQEASRTAVEFQEKSRPAQDFQEKSQPTADVPQKSRAGNINRPKSKMITSSSAAPATAFAWWRRPKALKLFPDSVTHLGLAKRFSLKELKVATDSFSIKNILGRGGFSEVYKGRFAGGSLVAVKRLKEEHTPGGELQFLKELETTSMPLHRNVLRLIGFCVTPTERLLVYPYMANGSVASWLRERPQSQPSLDWPTRKRIIYGSARGLCYLNDSCPLKIIHRDVKAANILLDENFEAVVGVFGLAKSIHHRKTVATIAVSDTIGHIAPECLSTGISSDNTDVFGYGIMLLELITGKRASDLAPLANDDGFMLLDWVKGLLKEKKLEMLVDPDLQNNYAESEVDYLIQVALLCIQDSPMDRPNMSNVVRMLESDLPIR